jgi:hypothetical protein
VPTALPPGARNLPPPEDSELPFPALHFLHNMITTALVLPASPQFHSIEDTLKVGEGFWNLRWAGEMSSVAAAMLILSLVVTSLGLGAAYQRLRWRGLVPLAVFLAYHLANAFARTSGGRYLVPVDWILVCYYGLGLSELLHLGYSLVRPQAIAASQSAHAPDAPDAAALSLRSLSIVPALFLIGCLVPLAGVLYPSRYSPQPASALASELAAYTSEMGLGPDAVESFLEEPGAVLFQGRALYPRYYRREVGVAFSPKPFQARSYPRTIFELIGPHGLAYAILPGRAPDTFPNATDALVLGCETREDGYRIVRVLVVVLPQHGVALSRNPPAALACPLPEPVCDNNGNCF